jgi:hypothetical protein
MLYYIFVDPAGGFFGPAPPTAAEKLDPLQASYFFRAFLAA